MRAIAILFACIPLASCVSGPSSTEIHPDGTIVRSSTGQTFMGRRKNAVAEVRTNSGTVLKYMAEEESSEDVPKSLISAWGAWKLAKVQGDVSINKDNNSTTEVLGAQGVQRNKDTLDAAGKVTSEAIPLVEGGPELLPIKPPGT